MNKNIYFRGFWIKTNSTLTIKPLSSSFENISINNSGDSLLEDKNNIKTKDYYLEDISVVI